MRLVAAVVLVLALTGCGKSTTEYAAVPDDTTSTTVPYDGRLHVTVVPDSYSPTSDALSSWRMDPAPAELRPVLTVDEVEAAWERSDFGRGAEGEWRYYFGLYSGNEPNPNAPDGRLTGVHRVENVPAWLVINDDQTFMPSRPASPPGEPRSTNVPVRGWSVSQLRDAPGAPPIAGIEQTGGVPPLVY